MQIPDGMDYQGECIRPPSEANSILLQATLGCSHNKCTFCKAFKNKRFAIKEQSIWQKDLQFAQQHCTRQRRMFVMDGDAFVMPAKRWEWLLTAIQQQLPWVERVSCYANAKSVALKSDAELARIRELGLSLLYYGLESGDDNVLQRINKGANRNMLEEQALRLKKHGFALSVTVLLGMGGKESSTEHAHATAELLSAIDPDYIGALSLMIIPGTPLHNEYSQGKFTPLAAPDILQELAIMLEHTELSDGLFMANHASNQLPLKAHLPRDKKRSLELLHAAMAGQVPLRPTWLRSL